MTPQQIIVATIGPFVYDAEVKAKNILDALELGGYCIRQSPAYPHAAISEISRDGEMKVM